MDKRFNGNTNDKNYSRKDKSETLWQHDMTPSSDTATLPKLCSPCLYCNIAGQIRHLLMWRLRKGRSTDNAKLQYPGNVFYKIKTSYSDTRAPQATGDIY